MMWRQKSEQPCGVNGDRNIHQPLINTTCELIHFDNCKLTTNAFAPCPVRAGRRLIPAISLVHSLHISLALCRSGSDKQSGYSLCVGYSQTGYPVIRSVSIRKQYGVESRSKVQVSSLYLLCKVSIVKRVGEGSHGYRRFHWKDSEKIFLWESWGKIFDLIRSIVKFCLLLSMYLQLITSRQYWWWNVMGRKKRKNNRKKMCI